MAKYTGADCKICRREGCKLFLKGERCLSKKCSLERRPNVPGVHGAARKKPTEYSLQFPSVLYHKCMHISSFFIDLDIVEQN